MRQRHGRHGDARPEPGGEERRQETADAEADHGGGGTGEDGDQEDSEVEEGHLQCMGYLARRASCFKELQGPCHARLVVLEDAPVPGILIEDELGVREAARQVD